MNSTTSRHLALLSLGVACLIVTAIAIALNGDYNSDALYPYSQAMDLLQFGTLDGWRFSAAPFVVPDVLLALPIAAATGDPQAFYLAAAPIQLLPFLLLIALYLRRTAQVRFGDGFVAGVAATAALALAGIALLPPEFFCTVDASFVLVHHGTAALGAIALYLYAHDDCFALLRRHWALSFAALVLLTLSDFYFSLYFGALLLVSARPRQWRPWLGIAVPFGLISILMFVISYLVNGSLREQVRGSLPSGAETYHAMRHAWSLLLVPAIPLAWLAHRRKLPATLACLYAALLVTLLLVGGAGLIKDVGGFRYVVIAYAVSILAYTYALLQMSGTTRVLVMLLASVGLVGYCGIRLQAPLLDDYRQETACLNAVAPPGSTIMAEYWPAKMVFESSHRRYNLWQVNESLHKRRWISNRRWRDIHPDNGITVVMTHHLAAQTLQQLQALPSARTVCGGRAVVVPRSAPSLLQR
ncbi:hypothetical protein NRY95_01325 [Xanthomonas campestris pv. phormiicola]|nr:hypothetical protein [Xanthomonas campestris pv. phormiicola]UYC16655.1 hypothetical protein NRY95_01325 [Xanthomonas campestris pv. phormiicola]